MPSRDYEIEGLRQLIEQEFANNRPALEALRSNADLLDIELRQMPAGTSPAIAIDCLKSQSWFGGAMRPHAAEPPASGFFRRRQPQPPPQTQEWDGPSTVPTFFPLSDNRYREAISLNDAGRRHLEQGEDAAALTAFSRALTLFEDLGVKEGQAHVMRHLGLLAIARDPGSFDEPWGWFSRSLSLAEDCDMGELAIWNLFEMGSIWMSSPHRAGAGQYLERALNFARELRSPTLLTRHILPQMLVWLGMLENDERRPTQAQPLFEEAIALLGALRGRESHIPGLDVGEGEITASIGLGNAYLGQGWTERAVKTLLRARALADESSSVQAAEVRRALDFVRSRIGEQDWARLDGDTLRAR
jgi:tetratricopeptide (TPR) repeat protein